MGGTIMKNIFKIFAIIIMVVAIDTVTFAADTTQFKIISDTNSVRVANGLAPLTEDPVLVYIAAIRVNEAAQNWSHTRPDGRPWYTAFNEVGYQGKFQGENLAKGYTANAVVPAWFASPSHQANLLDRRYTKIGVAYVQVNGELYVAQEFGN